MKANIMSETTNNPFEPFFEQIREIGRSEMRKATDDNDEAAVDLNASEAAEMLRRPYFSDRTLNALNATGNFLMRSR